MFQSPEDIGIASSSRNKKVQEQDYSESEDENNDDENDNKTEQLIKEEFDSGNEYDIEEPDQVSFLKLYYFADLFIFN